MRLVQTILEGTGNVTLNQILDLQISSSLKSNSCSSGRINDTDTSFPPLLYISVVNHVISHEGEDRNDFRLPAFERVVPVHLSTQDPVYNYFLGILKETYSYIMKTTPGSCSPDLFVYK